ERSRPPRRVVRRQENLVSGARVPYRPKLSVFAVLSSVVGAIAGLVFFQQRGSVFPTAAVGLITIVAGVVTGIVVPSLGRLVATARLNRRLARLAETRAVAD